MIKLRQFSFSDLDQILEIEKTSFPNRDAWSRDYFKKLYLKYPEEFIVAENKNEILGYIIGQPKDNSTEIISLAVKPAWRRKGIGKNLTSFLINHFKRKGVKEISLNIRTKNKVGIIFYQKLGFKISKIIRNYYRNGDDAYLMRKEI